MKKYLFLLLMAVSSYSFAVGEILEVQTTGKQYCGSSVTSFSPKNDYQLYFYVDSDSSVDVYDGFGDYILTLDVESNPISATKASANAFYGNTSDNVSLSGIITVDKYGVIKSVKGTFIRRGIIDDCYSDGKFTAKYIGNY